MGLGLLFTPQSGRKTRRQIVGASVETTERLRSCYGQVTRKLGATVEKGRGLMREGGPLLAAAVEAGREAYEREKAHRVAQTKGKP
jgi:gas vesicle protein